MAEPRRYTTTRTTPERVARVLLDAELFGDRAAGRRHGVHYNTIGAWRRDRLEDATVVAEMNRLRVLLAAGWIDSARDLRARLIERVGTLAAKSKRLDRVTDALRTVHEVIAAHEILNDPGGGDAEPEGADRREDPGEGEGPGGSPGDA